jgi:hypothetical protein
MIGSNDFGNDGNRSVLSVTGKRMSLVIGPLGIVSNLSNDSAGEATWNEGCIHIRQRARSVIMSVDSDLLTGPAVAAALYELADMQPQKQHRRSPGWV